MKIKPKFSFSTDFQLEILRFLIKDKEGILALNRLKPAYFTLIEHRVVADGIFKFYKKYKRIPSEAVLKESVKDLLNTKAYADSVVESNIKEIIKLLSDLYKSNLKDADVIKEKIWDYAVYVEMKNLNENFDLNDFNQYESYRRKINDILNKAAPKQEDSSLFMVDGVVDRQFSRQARPSVIPCPFRQLNDLTNGGGYPKGSVIVLLDKAKARKTFFLINFARGYLKQRKVVLYVDTENGASQIMDRMIQSTLNKTKREMMSGKFDPLEKKHLRKYKRLKSEFIVKRVLSGVADANTIKDLILEIKHTHGLQVSALVVDYAAKLASIRGDKDDFERISNVYVDLENLAHEMDLDVILTANHVTRSASERRETRYEDQDIAGCISIIRNAQVIMGLNSTPDEEANNILRAEIVVQRDGPPQGRALFNIDVSKQRLVEFTREQRDLYEKTVGAQLDNPKSKGGRRGPLKNPNQKPIDKNKKGDI